MSRSALHPDPPPLLRSPTLQRITERGALRIGYAPAPPWIQRTPVGLRGYDAEAVARLADALEVEPWFVEFRTGDLPGLLSAARIDIAVGGLSECPSHEVGCVRARHLVAGNDATTGRARQVHFPNVWWVERHDPVWRLRVAGFLFAERTRARLCVRSGSGR